MRLTIAICALPLLGVTFADCGVRGGTTVVANPNYKVLDELEACSTIAGDIHIDPAFSYFILDGPQEITGTIVAHDNEVMKALWLPAVRKLGGLSLANPTIGTRVRLEEVTEIGKLEWKNITWLYDFDYFEWAAPKLVTVSTLNVEDTYLSGFLRDYPSYDGSGFYYYGLEQLKTAGSVRVVNNERMDEVVLPALQIINGRLIVGNNFDTRRQTEKKDGNNLLISFPALESVGSVTIYDEEAAPLSQAGKIELPVLGRVFGDLNITDLRGVSEIQTPALTDINGGLYIIGNKQLKNLHFPRLRRVDHVVLDVGDEYYYGGFENISFPVLEEVGAFHVTSVPGFDCSSLDHIRKRATEFSCSTSDGGLELR
ncbi:hypothetical protein GGR50DRAFT_698430 [Xylaria sp. CBS 124048]|nr:hypothetical protein GGR50DRAFT_698430 [Xylaria sp. CBS 124048]